jgi:hypothetical protein
MRSVVVPSFDRAHNSRQRDERGYDMLRPVQTVRVTTKEELDAALATADRITVEGDDELLSYAARSSTNYAPVPPPQRRVWKIAIAAAAVLAIIVIILIILIFVGSTGRSVNAIAAAPPLLVLAWPLVTIIAIVALFLIARQAIAGDRNVTISWKVTDKVSGRLVITKVRERSTKRRAAA